MPWTNRSCQARMGNTTSNSAAVNWCGAMRYQMYSAQLTASSRRHLPVRSARRHGTAASTSHTYRPMISTAHGLYRMRARSRHCAAVMVRGSRNHETADESHALTELTSTPTNDSARTDRVTATQANQSTRARRPRRLATASQPSRTSRGPYTMPSTTPERTTNTSAALTSQNRSNENQLSTDDICE